MNLNDHSLVNGLATCSGRNLLKGAPRKVRAVCMPKSFADSHGQLVRIPSIKGVTIERIRRLSSHRSQRTIVLTLLVRDRSKQWHKLVDGNLYFLAHLNSKKGHLCTSTATCVEAVEGN